MIQHIGHASAKPKKNNNTHEQNETNENKQRLNPSHSTPFKLVGVAISVLGFDSVFGRYRTIVK